MLMIFVNIPVEDSFYQWKGFAKSLKEKP